MSVWWGSDKQDASLYIWKFHWVCQGPIAESLLKIEDMRNINTLYFYNLVKYLFFLCAAKMVVLVINNTFSIWKKIQNLYWRVHVDPTDSTCKFLWTIRLKTAEISWNVFFLYLCLICTNLNRLKSNQLKNSNVGPMHLCDYLFQNRFQFYLGMAVPKNL